MSQIEFGVVGTGDMGSAVGAALIRGGFGVSTNLSGRSAHSRKLAENAGMIDAGSLQSLVSGSSILLSILPPAAAASFAADVAALKAPADALFADCNAVSPGRVRDMAETFTEQRRAFIDVGIVGPPPQPDRQLPTRFFVSGPSRRRLLELNVPGILMIDMGAELGRASAMKMAYASLNKGVDALLTTIALASGRLGVREEFFEELQRSQAPILDRMRRRVPYLAAAAQRFAPEMREIASSFESVGVTGGFHEAAAWLYEVLAASPLGSETRADLPQTRSLDEALAAFEQGLTGRGQ